MTALKRKLKPAGARPRVRRPRMFRGRAAGKQRSRAFILGVGVAVLVFFGIQFYIGYNAPKSIPGRSYYTINAVMRNADNLEDHDQVRIGGELAGQILDVHVADHLAVMQLQLSSSFKPLRSDSTLRIRLRSAVGTRFLQIYPSAKGRPLPNGGTLQAAQAKAPVDLDEVLDTFNRPTRTGTQQLLGQLGVGLAGRGQAVNELLSDAPSFATRLGSVSAAVNARPGAVANLITGADTAADAFYPVRTTLADGFKQAARALQPLITARPAVEGTLQQAPPTLSEADTDLPAVNRLLAQVDGLAQQAVPTLHAAPGALRQTSELLTVAEPGLRQANATLVDLGRAVDPTVGFLQTVKPELPRLDQAFTNLSPTVSYVAARTCGLSDAFTGWSEMMKFGTDSENWIRFTVTKDPTILSGAGPALATPYPGPCTSTTGSNVGGPYNTPEQQYASPYHEPVFPNR